MLHPGLRLGDRYRLDDRIGAGGMGEVWRAYDEVLGRVVAVKAMLPDVAGEAGFARRFQTEAKAMASVNHPAVASIHDYGSSAGVTYLVMEFVDGESLAQKLQRTGRLSAADTMRLIAEAAAGLQAVHDRGIVHRDIKPANLLIRRSGSLLITDFGISRAQDSTHLTASGAILGTPTYLSPEQVLGQPATARSDVYSLGLTAYECLAGHRPFTGDNPYAVALQRLQVAPRTLSSDVPAAVIAVVERALATDPAHRWPSADALAHAARAALTGAPPHRIPGPAPIPPQPWPAGPPDQPQPSRGALPPRAASAAKRKRLGWAVAAALVLVLAGSGAAYWAIGRAGASTTAANPGGPSAGTGSPAAPAGFAGCGGAFCPVQPMCWGGMSITNGRTAPPGKIDCTEAHYWETFAAIPQPADAADVRQDDLMNRPDIATACSAKVMAARSTGAGATKGWIRDAFPVQIGGGTTWLMQCMARSEDGESTGAVFRGQA